MLISLNDKVKKIVIIFLLFIITSGIFFYTVKIREKYFGVISADHHQALTSQTLIYTKNWFREGALQLKFGHIFNPKSIEFSTLLSRHVHESFPPGSTLPIYIISKIINTEPNPSLIMKYNLINHFLLAFFISLTIFFFLLQLNFSHVNSFLFSISPILLELLLPGPLYWYQNVYFHPQAVILPIILFTFLEVIKERIKDNKKNILIIIIQGLLLLCGTMTDWLFIIFVVIVYFKRIFNNEMGKTAKIFIKRSVLFFIPSVISLGLFGFQLYSLGILPTIINKFKFRIGLSSSGSEYITDFYDQFWNGHISYNYGKVAIVLLWLSLAIFIASFIYVTIQYFFKNKIDIRIGKTLSLIGIVLLPCFIFTYILRNYCAIHDYSALTFSLPLAIVPFTLVPILIVLIFKKCLLKLPFKLNTLIIIFKKYTVKTKFFVTTIMAIIIILLASIYIINEHPRYKDFFPDPNKYNYEEVGNFISKNTQYEDVVFSINYEIPEWQPQKLSYSMKRVYKVDSVLDIYDKVSDIKEEFIINIFSIGEKNYKNNFGINKLVKNSTMVSDSNFYLYKIQKKDFMEIFKDYKLSYEIEQLFSNYYGSELFEVKKDNLIEEFSLQKLYKIEAFNFEDYWENLNQCEFILEEENVLIKANGDDPHFENSFLIQNKKDESLLIVVNLYSLVDEKFQIYYKVKGGQYSEGNSISHLLTEGDNIISIKLPYIKDLEKIRIDPVRNNNDCYIETIEIFSCK